MSQIINLYCDESCHLENDSQRIMAFGCLWCSFDEVPRLSEELRDIKKRHRALGELKWTKVSNARKAFYLELVQWFMAESPLHFRAWVVNDKQNLNHAYFNQGSHDTFYYKMLFSLIRPVLSPDKQHNIYLDVKDTRSRQKLSKLREVLCNDRYDFTGQMIKHTQNIHSYESELMQLSDFLLGAVSYRHRGCKGNTSKEAVIGLLEEKLGRDLLRVTSKGEDKFNIFVFTPRRVAP